MVEQQINKQKYNEELFNKVFKNIVLKTLIFNHIKLYKKNEIVYCNSIKDLRELKDREYIGKIVYSDSINLEIGDLPSSKDGILKSVELKHQNLTVINTSGVIPYGVEIIKFNGYHPDATTKFSSLPSSIHTLENAVVGTDEKDSCIIPSNITSISFTKFEDLQSSIIKIPNTIKTLSFTRGWNNSGKKIVKGDLPEGITSLAMDYRQANNIEKGVLPSTIKHLKIRLYPSSTPTDKEMIELFDFLPTSYNLESLFISTKYNISPISNFNRFSSIKKLTIHFYDGTHIAPNSLPSSITELTIYNITKPIERNVIPNSVISLQLFEIYNKSISKDIIPNSIKSLVLDRTFYEETNSFDIIFPQSLTSLEIIYDEDYYPYYDDDGCDMYELSATNINRMIQNCLSSLKSLVSITLPKKCKDINIIKFNNFEKILKIK